MRNSRHIPAFTLFEVTMVLAIMSILITIISVTLNRFNEQLKVSTEIQKELNEWYQFRSNLWRELYSSDSLVFEKVELNIYHANEKTSYKVEDDTLFRRKSVPEWKSTSLVTDEIREYEFGGKRFIEFDFLWKEDTMKLTYLCDESLKKKMDIYFLNIE